MRKKLAVGVASFVIGITVAGVLTLSSTRAKSEDVKAQPMQIVVDNFTFTPATLTVSPNTIVKWVNKDDVPHVIASDQGLFKSKALDTDDVYSYTFTKAGSYSYYCSIHPKMVGKIIVR